MSFASSLSTDRSLEKAIDSVVHSIQTQLGSVTPDLTMVFVSPHHVESCETLAATLCDRLQTKVLLGCSGETVVGGSREVEDEPALSVWSAAFPGARLAPFHVEFRRTPDGFASTGFPEPGENESDVRAILFLGEPYTTPPDSVLERFAEDFPNVPVIGGMASSTRHPGTNRLFFQREQRRRGGIGVVIRGGPAVHSIVSQGCRPIGTPFVVTRAEENVILGLGGAPPMKKFAELFSSLEERDQDLARKGLHLGLAMSEYRDAFGRGDFLISNVLGADPEQGSIAVGNLVRVGQTVQFHVRDEESAHEDLESLIRRHQEQHGAAPGAGLLFSCNGRGTRLFSSPDHDARALRERFGPIPLAGFFAQGEFGPVGKVNYIHGFTASVALFDPA